MEFSVLTYVLVSGAFFFAGIVDSVSGGGGLLTLPTFMLLGIPTHMISGTNQCSCATGSLISLARFIKSGKIYWPTAIIAGVSAPLASILGTRLYLIMPERYLQILMIVLLPIAAVVLLSNRGFGRENRVDTLSRGRQIGAALTIGIVWGCYTGFYGAGAGTFIMLSFALLNRLDLVTASGNTKVCSAFASVTAAISYAVSGAVLWKLVLPATVLNILGNYIGAGLAIHNGAKVIRPMFLAVLALLLVRLITTVLF